MNTKRLVPLMFLLILATVFSIAAENAKKEPVPKERTYEIEQRTTYKPEQPTKYYQVRFFVSLPTGEHGYENQKLHGAPEFCIEPLMDSFVKIDKKHEYFQIIKTEPFGDAVLLVEINNPPPAKEFSVVLKYRITCSSPEYDLDKLKKVRFKDMSKKERRMYAAYMQPELAVESNAPEVQAVLAGIFGKKGLDDRNKKNQSIYEYAEKIYQWMMENTRYNLDRDNLHRSGGVVATIKEGTGHCAQLSSLYVALCRGVGIPARFSQMVGPSKEGSDEPRLHVMPEIYIPSVGWYPLEVAASRKASMDMSYDTSRIAEWVKLNHCVDKEYRRENIWIEKATAKPDRIKLERTHEVYRGVSVIEVTGK